MLFSASEAALLAKVGGLGDVIESLPKALRALGVDARIILPRYQMIDVASLRSIKTMTVAVGDTAEPVTIYEGVVPGSTTPVYLLDHPRYLSSGGIYFDPSAFVSQFAEVERFLFFSLAVAQFLREGIFVPDIVHCHDWHTGFIVHLIKKHNLARKSIFTIHNLANQGQWNSAEVVSFLFGAEGHAADFYTSTNGQINLMAEGIANCDMLTTVSSTYAKEILTPEFGVKLEALIHTRKRSLAGIVNGIDVDFFDPSRNPHITHYSVRVPKNKGMNKAAVQKKFGFAQDPAVPLLAVVSRLTSQKGIDLILPIAETLFRDHGCQMVVLGRGDPKIESALRDLAARWPHQMALDAEFSEAVANLIYAGSDIFLVPSRFEPCGLTQMIANRYGTIPVVRKTGGLADTIQNYRLRASAVLGNGFVFGPYESKALLMAVKRALQVYRNDREDWGKLMRNAMKKDFSWHTSAKEYLRLYQKLMK